MHHLHHFQTHARLNQQASNFEHEIAELQSSIQSEAEAAEELNRLQAERANEGETAAEARRSADDKVLKGQNKISTGAWPL